MKTTSKKRMLISSVAMLLVAMLALGTATFAWFTSNTTARTDNLSVKTVKASELQVSSVHKDWTDSLDYESAGTVLKPASSVNGTNWYVATAASKSAFDADAKTVTTPAAGDLKNYVFVDQLNVRNNGGAPVEHVTISFNLAETEANSGKYVRLALVPVASKGNPTDGVPVPKASDFASNVYCASATDTANAISGVTTKTVPETDKDDNADEDGDGNNTTKTVYELSTSAINATSGANKSIDIGTLNAKETTGSAKYFNLYIWFEGQDENCKDANAGNYTPNIAFTVTGNTIESAD